MASEKDGSGFPAPAVIAVLVALASAVVVNQTPLVSSRPGTADKVVSRAVDLQDVDARLWQDPFSAADQHRERVGAPGLDRTCADGGSKTHGLRHRRACFRAEVEKVAGGQDGVKHLVVMPVMVFGGPNVDDIESRRRTRYAVLSGLNAAGFRPLDERHIGYVEREDSDPPRLVPYEWFRLREDRPGVKARVLVLWVDENGIKDQPFAEMARLLDELSLCSGRWTIPGTVKVDVQIIGPQGARVLRLISNRETESAPEPCTPSASMYSTSTDDDPTLRRTDTGRWITPGSSALAADGVSFTRAITRDRDLLHPLGKELRLRGVQPGRRDGTVIVAEWDTYYSRRLLTRLRRQFCDVKDGPCLARIVEVSYLRGLDGILPPAPQSRVAGETKPDDDGQPRRDADKTTPMERMERPEGNAQLDYLRRLTGTVRRVLDEAGIVGVGAIGVLGSDTYDKLLVLQALRDRYPEAVFFTTDLDARFQHPRESAWARNLVVLSSFGLELTRKWQRDVPPFRDSYQTASFLATQLAFCEWSPACRDLTDGGGFSQNALDAEMKPPRIFEIGRTTSVDLSDRPDFLHPAPPSRRWPWSSIVVVLASALGLAYLSSLWARDLLRWTVAACRQEDRRARRRWIGIWASIPLGMIALALVVVVIVRDGREPFAWFEGVSIWPTELVRLAAAILAGFLGVHVWKRVGETTATLSAAFFSDVPKAEADAVDRAHAPRGRFRPLLGTRYRTGHDQSPVNPFVGWRIYCARMSAGRRLVRVGLSGVAYLVLASAVVAVDRFPTVPYRGDVAYTVDKLLLWSCVLLFTFLTFLVADAVWACQHYSHELGRDVPTEWPEGVLTRYADRWGLKAPALESVIDVEFIAVWTKELASMVYYPALVLGLMAVARNGFFDRWDTPYGLLLVFVLSPGYTAAHALMLRRVAERNRTQALEALRAERIAEAGLADNDKRVKQLDLVIERVSTLQDGAFAPLSRQPFVRAVLLPLSGAGGVALLEYLLLAR